MENWDWESEELLDQEMVFLNQLLVARIIIPISFLLWPMLYPPKACFMFSTVQGTTFMPQEFSSGKMLEVNSQNYLAFHKHWFGDVVITYLSIINKLIVIIAVKW